MNEVRIDVVQAVSGDLVRAFAEILPTLGGGPTVAPTERDLVEMIETPCTTLLVARTSAEETIAGILTLVLFRQPTGVQARIEDLVVRPALRGRGIGEALCRRAMELAEEKGATFVELTSSPAREAANQLYRKLGFTTRKTNVYRLAMERPRSAD